MTKVDTHPLFKISQLVRSWSRINITRDERSLVEYAKQNGGKDDAIQMLMKHEATMELAHAVMAGDVERTRRFLCHGDADIHTCDRSVCWPRWTAGYVNMKVYLYI